MIWCWWGMGVVMMECVTCNREGSDMTCIWDRNNSEHRVYICSRGCVLGVENAVWWDRAQFWDMMVEGKLKVLFEGGHVCESCGKECDESKSVVLRREYGGDMDELEKWYVCGDVCGGVLFGSVIQGLSKVNGGGKVRVECVWGDELMCVYRGDGEGSSEVVRKVRENWLGIVCGLSEDRIVELLDE